MEIQARHWATLCEDERARFGRPRVDGNARSTDEWAVWEETSRGGSTTVRARARCDAEREWGGRAKGGGITRGIAIAQLRWMIMMFVGVFASIVFDVCIRGRCTDCGGCLCACGVIADA